MNSTCYEREETLKIKKKKNRAWRLVYHTLSTTMLDVPCIYLMRKKTKKWIYTISESQTCLLLSKKTCIRVAYSLIVRYIRFIISFFIFFLLRLTINVTRCVRDHYRSDLHCENKRKVHRRVDSFLPLIGQRIF